MLAATALELLLCAALLLRRGCYAGATVGALGAVVVGGAVVVRAAVVVRSVVTAVVVVRVRGAVVRGGMLWSLNVRPDPVCPRKSNLDRHSDRCPNRIKFGLPRARKPLR